ncbi:MAG: bacteriohopanetetrol glucosamine biosynthesis glycosyltransferase HpnI [Solirubrobacteraceae bacterium]
MHELRVLAGLAMAAGAALYALLAAGVMGRMRRSAAAAAASPVASSATLTPVTLLKPLCGAEPGLEDLLASFCRQDYPCMQILFGVRAHEDPAVAVVSRLQARFPALDIELVIDPALHGCNHKVSNLINMLPRARHPWLVLADSDIRVPQDYLSRVSSVLSNPRIGLVTCPYLGVSVTSAGSAGRTTAASRLGAMFINEWFMPSVLLAAAFGSRSYVSGATIALRREVLSAVGGFAALADTLADDHRLGRLVRRQGLKVHLSDVAVETMVAEPTFGALCRHELRWLATIQSVQPLGFACCFPTFGLPMAFTGAALAAFNPTALVLLGITAAARLVLHYFGVPAADRGRRSGFRLLALLPARDALLVALWAASFCNREIVWREQRFGVGQDGSLHRIG